MRCPTCQGETGPAASVCPTCGAPLSLREEGPPAPLDRPLDLDRRAGPLPGAPPPAAVPRAGPAPRPPPPPRPVRAAAPLVPASVEDLAADPSAEVLAVPPPAGGVVELRRGGSVRRAAAWAVDAGPFALATLAIAEGLGATALPVLAPLAGVAALASFTYQTLAHWLSGATLGKRLVGLRVVGPDGRPPGPGRSALRAAAAVAGVALLGVGPLLALFTRSGRAAHDWVAGTSVVDAP